MTTGVFAGGICHYPITTAYSDECASQNVSDATGAYVQCSGYSLPVASGAWMTSNLSLKRFATATATTSTSYTRPVAFEVCEVQDYSYFQPYIVAWVAACVAVLAAKTIIRKVIDRDTI
jgi:hypothetical protein